VEWDETGNQLAYKHYRNNEEVKAPTAQSATATPASDSRR
jgi:hypothetical protein